MFDDLEDFTFTFIHDADRWTVRMGFKNQRDAMIWAVRQLFSNALFSKHTRVEIKHGDAEPCVVEA